MSLKIKEHNCQAIFELRENLSLALKRREEAPESEAEVRLQIFCTFTLHVLSKKLSNRETYIRVRKENVHDYDYESH